MKKIKIILFVVALATLNFSCIVDDTTGDDQLNAFTESPYVVGFNKKLDAVSYFADEGVVQREFKIQLIGGQNSIPASKDIIVNYEIDPTSSATEGVEFDFTSNTGSVVIPAGETFTSFILDINTGNFDSQVRTELILKLTSTDSNASLVSTTVDTLSISFVGCVSDAYLYQYDVVVKDLRDNSTFNRGTEIIYFEDTNNFRTASTATLGANGQVADMLGFDFSVLCGDINIPSQGLLQNFFAGNELVGTESTSIDANGDFVLKYSANYGGATGVVNFEATYTKL